jgi:hypothetical protein
MMLALRPSFSGAYLHLRPSYGSGAQQILVWGDFERSTINAALCTVSTDADGPIVDIVPRRMAGTASTPDRWGYPLFKVTGVNGLRPKFRIQNYSNTNGAGRNYQTWTPQMRAHYSYDQGVTWHPLTEINVANGNLWFRHGTAFTQDEVWIAQNWPRSVTRVGQQIEELAAAHPTKIHPTPTAAAFTPTLTTTFPAQDFIYNEVPASEDELGRPVPAVPLYSFVIDDKDLGDSATKKHAIITAGFHGGEDVGEIVHWEMVDFLLGDSPEAIQLRTNYLIFDYSLLNPSGRFAGFWRSAPHAPAVDPNSEWNEEQTPSPQHPLVNLHKSAVYTDLNGDLMWWGFDLHATRSGARMQTDIRASRPIDLAWETFAKGRYPGGDWGDYNDRNAVPDYQNSRTLRGWQVRVLGSPFGMLMETCDAKGPISPAQMRPYAEAAVGAVADMDSAGWFGIEALAPGAFIETQVALAAGSASGQAIAVAARASTVASLATGPAVGAAQGPGAILTTSVAMRSGAASGAGLGTASGTTIGHSVSLLPGGAVTGANAPGKTLSSVHEIISGFAAGGAVAAAPGAVLEGGRSLLPGEASGAERGTAPGTTVSSAAVLIRGMAAGGDMAVAPGADFGSRAELLAGTAVGRGMAVAALLESGGIFIPGAASGAETGTARGAVFSASVHLMPGRMFVANARLGALSSRDVVRQRVVRGRTQIVARGAR